MRALFLAVLCAATAHAATAPLDIDQPRVLERVMRDNPEHYAKIEKILAAAKRVPALELPSYLPTAVGASDVRALPVWKVSDPPKLRLEFTLDATHYTATVTGRVPWTSVTPPR